MGQLVPGKSLDTHPTQGRGTVQHAGSHVNFKSYFRLGRAETAGWWSFPPASSRGVCLQQHSSGSGGGAGMSQASSSAPSSHKTAWRRAAAAPQPGRTPFTYPHGFCSSLFQEAAQLPEVLAHPGSCIPGSTAAPSSGRDILASCRVGTEVWHGEGHTDTAQGFLWCSCCS